MENLIQIKDLSIGFASQGKRNNVVHSISFDIPKGRTVALVGESGSGKTVTALSILKLLPYPNAYHQTGEIIFKNKNILSSNQKDIERIRGKNISAIFQEPMNSLNPLHTIQKQINEVIMLHSKLNFFEANKKTYKLLERVGLKDITMRPKSYPHELSGGQRQRVMIAMSIANNPELLIADEPTTALDVTIQIQILKLLKEIQANMNMSILFISHNLAVVKNIADYVCIMKDGLIVEQESTLNIFNNPQHEYTKKLISSQPQKKISENIKSLPILKVNNLKVWYPVKKGILRKIVDHVKAVDGVNFDLYEKQTLGIVGESGSGKTSLILALLKLIQFKGNIYFDNQLINEISNKKLRYLRKSIQVVFQDPFSSLSPRMTVEQIVSEGLKIHKSELSKKERYDLLDKTLNDVGLSFKEISDRYPHEFSGGQRQRIAIARALVLKPRLIIFDEPTSALDINIQTQIIDLLNVIQKKYKLSYIFISHDLKVINSISDNILVLKQGKIVEMDKKEKIFNEPKEIYTKQLLEASLVENLK